MPATKNARTAPKDLVQSAPASSIRRSVWVIAALAGALAVVALYLIVPLMTFFGAVNDLLTQILGALLILAIGEFVIFSILLKTARSTRLDSAKMRTALINSQDTDNVPFDILVNSETTSVPVLKPEDIAAEETQQQESLSRNA
jgi:hypothetical protein